MHVHVVSVKEFLSGAIPTDVAVWLGVHTEMVAIHKALGMTLTSRLASGASSRDDRCSITGCIEFAYVPE